MTLQAGSHLGSYEVLAPLGAGGMGEVYRARDERLGRDVAIKVLPAAFASDPERLKRFAREARSASALNHPNIVTIYEIGSSDSISYIAMELVEGEPLRALLRRGALPLRRLFQIGVQVADGLAKAHASGIVHRDLKPENLMLTEDGIVKILDFGLAKLTQPEGSGAAAMQEPTVSGETAPGFVMGTAGYMSPEQALGGSVDFRSDQFAFGSILYEMATGRRAFHRGSAPETLTAVIREEPEPIATLNPKLPAPLRWIVERCLAKESRNRYASTEDLARDLATVRDHLSEAISGVALAASPPRRRWALGLILGAAALAIAAMSLLRPRPPAAELRAIRFSIRPPPNADFWGYAFSPDGSQLACVVARGEEPRRIWLRPLSAAEARAMPGTENVKSVFWSPDSRSLGFFAAGKLWRVDLSGGAPVPICDVYENLAYAGTWGTDGQIVFFSERGEAIYRVSTSGGKPVAIVKADRARGETKVTFPWFLPDGKSFLYLLRQENSAGSLMLFPAGGPARPLFPIVSRVEYVDPGYVVFVRDGTLIAQRFDPRSGTVSGEPFSLADSVGYSISTGESDFATSRGGALAFRTRTPPRGRMAWFDRAGRLIETLGPAGDYHKVAIDPDGRKVLFDRAQPKTGTRNLWILDLERRVEARVTSDPTDEYDGLWLPDGKSIVYTAQSGGMVQLRRRELATGRMKALLPNGDFEEAGAVVPGGAQLAYTHNNDRGNSEMRLVSLSGDQKSSPLPQTTAFDEGGIQFSPDGRCIAFADNDSGHDEIYVAPIASPGEKIRISFGGARHGVPLWSRDGSEIFYLSLKRQLISVPVRTAPSLSVGNPSVLFTIKEDADWDTFDASPDGKRFLVLFYEGVDEPSPLNVVLNWTAETATQGSPAR